MSISCIEVVISFESGYVVCILYFLSVFYTYIKI